MTSAGQRDVRTASRTPNPDWNCGRDVLDVVPVREDERKTGSDTERAERRDERVHAQHGHDERIHEPEPDPAEQP